MTATAAPAQKPPRARFISSRWTGWGFMAPSAAVFILVFIAPILYSIYLSFFRTQLVGGAQFVGIGNYLQAFQDPQFREGVGRVALFLAIQVPIMLLIALYMPIVVDSLDDPLPSSIALPRLGRGRDRLIPRRQRTTTSTPELNHDARWASVGAVGTLISCRFTVVGWRPANRLSGSAAIPC